MILSMTGYGKAESQLTNHRKVVVELRSLNSKALDLSMRFTPQLRVKELDIRSIVGQRLERGKIDLAIYYQDLAATSRAEAAYPPLNKEAFCHYYKQLKELQAACGEEETAHLMELVMRIPEVLKANEEDTDISKEEWDIVHDTINKAIDAFVAFRTQEGAALERMFTEKLDSIAQLLAEVEPYEKSRVEKIRQHLWSNLNKLEEETKQKIDQNRMEQEMIYYLEKLDITEEKVRLTNHLKYFRETMAQSKGVGETKDTNATAGVGKKLGFIAQEMGREINTLGSKSNQSEMQIIVVKMKDILEQIKEQVLNVL